MGKLATNLKRLSIATAVAGSLILGYKACVHLSEGDNFEKFKYELSSVIYHQDLKNDLAMREKIMMGDEEALAKFLATPEEYNPMVQFAASRAFLEKGERDEAAFWFYLAQLRTRADALKMKDRSSHNTSFVLNWKYGPAINNYALGDVDNLTKIINRVSDFDKNNPRNWDVRWVSAYSDSSALGKPILTKPKSEWETIHRSYAEEYQKNFFGMLKEFKRHQNGEITLEEFADRFNKG